MSAGAARLAMIVAMARNGVIGKDNALPWHIPEDLRWFRSQTLGKPVIMGRSTWQSIGRPLPGRDNIVVSRDPDFIAEGALVADSPEASLKLAQQSALSSAATEIMVIGGATLYRHFLPDCQQLYLTWVDEDVEGDTWFPEWNESEFTLIHTEPLLRDTPPPVQFRIYQRQTRDL